MKTLVTSILAFLLISVKLLVAQSAPYIEFDSPIALETITGITSADEIPLTLEFTYATDPNALRTEYIELITQDNIYQGFLGNGIPNNWNLESGTYTWTLKQYDYFYSLDDTIPTCSTTVVFTVKNTIGFETDPGGYIIVTDDGAKYQGDQVYRKTDSYLTIKAPNQTIGGDYYIWVNVWDNNGLEPSEWEITKYGENAARLSQSYQYTYKVERDDNGAIIKDYLRYDEVPPAAPQNLSVESTGQYTHPLVTWSANGEDDLSGYKVYRKKESESWHHIATVTTNSYTDDDILVPIQFQKFTYKVSAFDINNNISGYSNEDFIYGYKINKTNTAEEEKNYELPKEFLLSQNYPNPFNPSTSISYSIPKDEHVSIRVFNALGKEVANLVNGFKHQGQYSVQFDGSDLSSGIYYYEIRTNSFHNVKKMILTK